MDGVPFCHGARSSTCFTWGAGELMLPSEATCSKNIHQYSCTPTDFIENCVSEKGEGFGLKVIFPGNYEKDKEGFKQGKVVMLQRN